MTLRQQRALSLARSLSLRLSFSSRAHTAQLGLIKLWNERRKKKLRRKRRPKKRFIHPPSAQPARFALLAYTHLLILLLSANHISPNVCCMSLWRAFRALRIAECIIKQGIHEHGRHHVSKRSRSIGANCCELKIDLRICARINCSAYRSTGHQIAVCRSSSDAMSRVRERK